jgi:hypothetical protein
MGLDQYFFKNKKEVGYFRKFNALHGYMVELAGREINCEPFTLNKKQLEELQSLVKSCLVLTMDEKYIDSEYGPMFGDHGELILQNGKGKEVLKVTVTDEFIKYCKEVLLPAEGFFFGPADINDAYLYDMYDLWKILDLLLQNYTETDKIQYDAWW